MRSTINYSFSQCAQRRYHPMKAHSGTSSILNKFIRMSNEKTNQRKMPNKNNHTSPPSAYSYIFLEQLNETM